MILEHDRAARSGSALVFNELLFDARKTHWIEG